RQGASPAVPGRRGADDVARTNIGQVELQDVRVVAQVLPLVLLRLRPKDQSLIMSTIVVSGSARFIGGYLVQELLARGHQVIGIDNHSKYGPVARSYDDHPRYSLVEGDARDVDLMTGLLLDADHFIAGAAMIGGISYFHAYAYDLLATNERIMAASCDAAIK